MPMSSVPIPALPPARTASGVPRGVLWAGYIGVWVVAGVFLAVAELQHYLRRGGLHPWEPFLWELSSTLTASLLVLGVFRWHVWLRGRAAAQQLGGHLLGLLVYVLLHCAGMYGLRAIVYAWSGVRYE